MMIKYEEHSIGHSHLMCCEYYPDKSAAERRQIELRVALLRPIFIQYKKSLKTSEGVYNESWFVYYYAQNKES